MRPFMVSPKQQKRIDTLIDMAYDFLESQASPKRPMPQHLLTKVDVRDVEKALAELASLTRGDIWVSDAKHIKSILEMLYAYGVSEAQGRLVD